MKRVTKERFFVCLFLLTNLQQEAGHVLQKKKKSSKPLCLGKNNRTEYFLVFIFTSISLADFYPKIRAFTSEISKHLPAKPGLFCIF